MDMYESLFSPGGGLSEQIALQVFETLPEEGPLVVIMDRQGNCLPSDSEEFSKLDIRESFLKELCAKIDDGVEPVITQMEKAGIIAAQLATERTNCGYVVIVLPQYTPESILININVIETMLNQIGLIAKLIEKNHFLYELQMKHYNMYSQGERVPN